MYFGLRLPPETTPIVVAMLKSPVAFKASTNDYSAYDLRAIDWVVLVAGRRIGRWGIRIRRRGVAEAEPNAVPIVAS